MSEDKPSFHSRAIGNFLAFLCRLLTGVRSRWIAAPPNQNVRIYYANHSSHLDGLVIWASMPKTLRHTVHPVAAADYWSRGRLRRYIAEQVFCAVLIERHASTGSAEKRQDPLIQMRALLENNQSLILFPEGTRGSGETIADFKSGLYHLANQCPHVELVPVYLENLNRVLPKGSSLVVPVICSATFGAAIAGPQENEDKAEFLARARRSLEALAP